jgi:glycosyltransferase involved in cell wall biosynthesis
MKFSCHLDSPGKKLLHRAINSILIRGWAFDGQGFPADKIEIHLGKRIILCAPQNRPDVVAYFSSQLQVQGNVGFTAHFKTGAGFKFCRLIAHFKNGDRITLKRLLFRTQKKPAKKTPSKTQLTSEDYIRLDQLQKTGPLISILIPVYNTPGKWLIAAIESVRHQSYKNWELCIADDASPAKYIKGILAKYAASDKRIKITYRPTNGHIAACSNTALGLASGIYCALLDHDDTLDHNALFWVADTINNHPNADYIYTDEDKLEADGSSSHSPFYKPDWAPEYFLAMMYTCHLSVFRTALIRELGGFRPEFNGAQDYDLTLRVTAKTNHIHHIPIVLYHWRLSPESTALTADAKPYAEQKAALAIESFLKAKNENFELKSGPLRGHHQVRFLPRHCAKISIVIPTANGSLELAHGTENHIDAIYESIKMMTDYPDYEIIIVHNLNLSPKQLKVFGNDPLVRLVSYDQPTFNLSNKINLGCSAAQGEYLVILNDDIRIKEGQWLRRMLGIAQREGVGCVGPKLLFPDNTIQHAGVVLIGCLPGHAYYQWPHDALGYALGAQVNRSYLAVTGACQMTPRHLFTQLGGYSPKYPLNYNDVDYCLRLHQLGYRSVYIADVELMHYEGVSKEGGRSVGQSEVTTFLNDWYSTYKDDPFYNKNLSQKSPYGND